MTVIRDIKPIKKGEAVMPQGNIVALSTPFCLGKGSNPKKYVDYPSLKRLIDHVIDGEADGVVPCGTTGESPTLNRSEHLTMIRHTIDFVNGRIPVYAGTGSNSTDEAVELSIEAVKLGVNGLLVVTPYYNKPTHAGLVHYYSRIRLAIDDATDAGITLPIILYDIPGRTGIKTGAETIAMLANSEIIQALKWASGDFNQLMSVYQSCSQNRFSILSGDDNLTLPAITLGAKGVISVASNIIPKAISNIVTQSRHGLPLSRSFHYQALDLMKVLFCETNPLPVKYALWRMGIFNECIYRSPMVEMEPKNKEMVYSVLEQYHLV